MPGPAVQLLKAVDTVKIAGKRVGPAEFESVLVGHPTVAEAAAVSVPHPLKGEGVVCFVVLRSGEDGPAELAEELKGRVAAELGRPLAPEAVLFVPGLPKTRTGKVMRRVLRSVYLGVDPGDVSSLEDAGVLDEIGRG